MASDGASILLSSEAEAYVESLEVIPIKDIGSPRWTKQHEYVEKLNMQAVLHASANEDEYIKELLIQHEKIPVLISDLICSEIWQQKVFSIIKRMDFEPHTTIPLYISLYHEATLVNLLETILYHKEPCEAAADCILDMIDYCYRKITYLIARQESGEEEEEATPTKTSSIEEERGMEELKKQDRKLQFDISIKAVSILRYITDHIAELSLSVTSRILNTNDFPCLLVQLIENPPWTKYRNGVLKKFIDGKWHTVPSKERMRLTKIEGQVWIALFNLLLGPTCQEKYEFNSHNKAQILKLRAHLSEVILDQIPSLCDLQRYLSHLSMMDPPSSKTGLVLEQVPEVWEGILRANEGKWAAIAKHQVKTVFNPSAAAIREQARRFAETYSLDVLENLITEPPKCAVCGEPATKRCSRCQNEWYCRRECQVQHWSKHKQACQLITASHTIKTNDKTS
ncbi:zinc finger MYND domain-containing protein 10-like isoform X1 [Acanthaster planci]|uniref:Zinc finger MYND domain-containing protein 10 n=1 Tax=Acanthaster planci TaxID=133434 RepID=A0A8B7YYH7_ACAPL|nr:zinc finger MYND domain-containing protein 10-like isoform X1 [Acanthaster planci]